MKRVVVLLAIFLVGLSSFAQSQKAKIYGYIKDSNGQVLIGATITTPDAKIGVVSNQDGYYEIFDVDFGNLTLNASFLGYETEKVKLKVNKSLIELNYTLFESSILGENVIVRAIRANAKTPVAYSNIDKENLEQNNVVQDIPYLLEVTPSVVATSESGTGVGYTNIRIRGTDATRINVTVNGIPLNDAESQGLFWVNMPDFTSSVDNIQIQRGVGTSTNGAAAFGATINFQTIGLAYKPYANVSSTYGSFNTFKNSIQAGTGLLSEHFSFDLRYSNLKSDGFIQRGFADHQSTYLSGAYYANKTLIKANVILGEEHTGITWWGVPDYMMETDRTFNPAGEFTDDNGNTKYYDNQTDNYWQNHYQLIFAHSVNRHLNLNAALHATTGKGYYEQYKAEDDFSDYGIQNIELGDSILQIASQEYVFPDSIISASDIIRQKWLNNIFYGFTGSASYSKNKLDVITGGGWNQYNGDHYGLIKWSKFNAGLPLDYEWYRNTGLKTDWNVFTKFNYQLIDRLNLYVDIQYRNINYSMEGPDDDLVLIDQKHKYSFLNPKFGALYSFSDNSKLFFSFAIANREPSRADLKDAVKDGLNIFPVQETLFDYELGYTYKTKKLNIGLNAYYMNYLNQLVLTGELNSVGYPVMTNVAKSYRSGIELTGGVKIVEQLKWEMNFTLSRNKIQDYVEYSYHYDDEWNEELVATNLGNTDISYSPNMVGASVITYSPIERFSVFFTSKYVGSQYFDNTSSLDRRMDPYFINNLRVAYSIKMKGVQSIDIQLLVNNIFNAEYESNAYGGNWYEQGVEKTWAYYYPQAGINYMFKLGLKF